MDEQSAFGIQDHDNTNPEKSGLRKTVELVTTTIAAGGLGFGFANVAKSSLFFAHKLRETSICPGFNLTEVASLTNTSATTFGEYFCQTNVAWAIAVGTACAVTYIAPAVINACSAGVQQMKAENDAERKRPQYRSVD